ncbi:hypothetical protein Pam2_25 [Pseudanabaena phage Pam2]|nr:hypothetical protein Pam2_25 [Pseudanabaena phage Pam2]
MSNIQIALGVANPKVLTTLDLDINPVKTIGDAEYIPITIALAQADITASVIPIATQSKLKAEVAGAFDKVRVGDFITAIATGSLTAKNNVAVNNVYLASGLKEITYDENYNSTNLGVKSGDAITVASAGTGIPANTIVTKIDYTKRKIYIDKTLTESKVASVSVTPKIRVTAVRKSTATSNPNEIDFDSTVATTGVAGNVTIKGGAVDGVLTVIRVTPVDSLQNAKAVITIDTTALNGSQVKGSTEGFNGLVYDTLTYNNVGRYETDLDTYRTLAGVAAPTGA